MVTNILPTNPPHPGDGVNRSKFNFVQNMVMLHIKLNGIAKCSNIEACGSDSLHGYLNRYTKIKMCKLF